MFGGDTNAYLKSAVTTPPTPENFDEEIQLITKEGTNSARFLPIEYHVKALTDTNFAFAKRQCILMWNTAEPNLWERIKKLVR